MGIDSISSVNGATAIQAQNTQAARPAAPVEEKAAEKPAEQSAATSQPVVNAKVAENSQGGKANSDKQQQEQAATEDSMLAAAKDINKLINQNTIAEFGYHESTHRITIKIKDKDTDEVIKEIPSEKALKMIEKAWEIAGILVDEKR